MSLDMSKDELKQVAKRKRERKFRLWLNTLSWTTPVMAFAGFYTLWHDLAQVSLSHGKAAIVTNRNSQHVRVLYQVGSQGPAVSALQSQLAALGYFHHDITQYYGSITEASVSAFQAANHLPQTGKVDTATFTLLQQSANASPTTSDNRIAGSVSSNPSVLSNPVSITSAS